MQSYETIEAELLKHFKLSSLTLYTNFRNYEKDPKDTFGAVQLLRNARGGGVGRVWHFVTGGGRAERYVTPKKKFYMYNIIL